MGNRQQLGALTGLRFLAAFAVFVHHLGGKFGFPYNAYCIGSQAVTFFFVLSGFILTYVYTGQLNDWKNCRKYWFTRFARIWPLHAVCLLMSIVSMGLSWQIGDWQSILKLLLNTLLLQSWHPDPNWAMAFNSVAWSISTEAWFYLMFPFLFAANGEISRVRVISATIIVGVCGLAMNLIANGNWFGDVDYFNVGHVNPFFRWPEFLLGAFIGRGFLRRLDAEQATETIKEARWFQFVRDTVGELVVLAAIAAAAFWYRHSRIELIVRDAAWGSSFLAAWLRVLFPALFCGVAIRVFASSQGAMARFFSLGPVVYLGEISYAFYLVHFMVLRSIYLATPSYVELTPLQIAGLALAITVGLSMLLYAAVEMPCKKGLLELYRNGWTASVRKSLWELAKPTMLWVLPMALTCGPVFVLIGHVPTTERASDVQLIVDRSPEELKGARFGSEMLLLGAVLDRLDESQAVLKMAWLKRTEFPHRRLVRLVDAAGETVARGANNDELFRQAQNGDEIYDEVRLKIDHLQITRQIEVSFRHPDKGVLQVSSRFTAARQRSLVIVTEQQLAKLFGH